MIIVGSSFKNLQELYSEGSVCVFFFLTQETDWENVP